jgi:hypothetical protein
MARGTIDEETRALIRSAKAMSEQVDRLRRRLDSEGVLLTPTQYDRIANALARIGMLGGVLLADDLARTDAAEHGLDN